MDFVIYTKSGTSMERGVYSARDEHSAEEALTMRGRSVVDIRRLRCRSSETGVPKKHVLQFFSKLRICSRIDMPIVDALKLCENVMSSKKFAAVIAEIRTQVAAGRDIAECMWGYPRIFSPVICRLMEVGTASGTVTETCDKIFYMLNLEMSTRRKVLGALYYPAIVMAALLVAVYILVAKTIPAFLMLFEGSGVELPLPTRALMFMSDVVKGSPFLTGSAVLLVLLSLAYMGRLYSASHFVQKLALKIAPFSSLIKYSQRLSFCSTLHTILGAGVPILSALRMTRNSLSNIEFKKAAASAVSSVYIGRGMSAGLEAHSSLLSPDIVKSIEFAEKTGALGRVLKDMRDEYEAGLEYQIQIFKETVNPLITAVIAAAVLFILLALFLPMFSMSQAITSN